MRGWPGVTVTAVGSPGSTRSGAEQLRASAVAPQLQTRMPPRCCTRGRRWCSPNRGSKLDDGRDGAVLSGDPANEQGRRQQHARDLGDHPFAERQAALCGAPRGLQAGGAGTVAADDDGRVTRRTQPERSGVTAAHEATEHRWAVEAGHAHPVDGTVRGDQRGGARVTEEPMVLDRSLAARVDVADRSRVGEASTHLNEPSATRRGRCRRRGGRRWPRSGSAGRS